MNTFSTGKTLLAVTQSRLRQDPQRLAARRRIIRMRRQDGLENRKDHPPAKPVQPSMESNDGMLARAPKEPRCPAVRAAHSFARSGNPLFDLRNEIDTLFDRFSSTSLFAPFGSRLMARS